MGRGLPITWIFLGAMVVSIVAISQDSVVLALAAITDALVGVGFVLQARGSVTTESQGEPESQ